MGTSWHLSVTFYLLLPTHIASLEYRQYASQQDRRNPTLAILLLLASILSSISDTSPKSGCDKSAMSMFGIPFAM